MGLLSLELLLTYRRGAPLLLAGCCGAGVSRVGCVWRIHCWRGVDIISGMWQVRAITGGVRCGRSMVGGVRISSAECGKSGLSSMDHSAAGLSLTEQAERGGAIIGGAPNISTNSN